jgi:hypothetical protein
MHRGNALAPWTSLILGLTLLASMPARAAGIGTAFTYQGRLASAGIPITGQYDFDFRLFDAVTGGNHIGSDVFITNQTITAGLFTVQLDFGAAAFNGTAMWLEIGVRPAGGGAYTTLAPRQPLTPAPFAEFAANSAQWQQSGNTLMNGNGTNFVGVNRNTRVSNAEYFGVQAPVSSGFGGMYINTTGAAGQPFYGYATPGAFAWHYLDGTTGNWVLTNNNYSCLTATNTGQIGIGTSAPGAPLEVDGGSAAIIARADPTTGYAISAYGNNGVYAVSNGANGGSAIYGACTSADGYGIEGYSGAGANGIAVDGYASAGLAVYGQTATGTGVYGTNGGSNSVGYAGYFSGRVNVAGNLSKSGGSFKIDHPLDPANQYLYHSFVESPDMKNIYDGVVVLDANGEAVVTLPDWFEALNRDFRYQLTAIGAAAPNLHIAQEVADGQFGIAGGQPGQKVSWQVTGIRQDPWAEANRIPVEEPKSADERGRYIHPELYGLDASYSVDPAARSPHPRRNQDSTPSVAGADAVGAAR